MCIREGGGKSLMHKMWIKNMFFFNPSLTPLHLYTNPPASWMLNSPMIPTDSAASTTSSRSVSCVLCPLSSLPCPLSSLPCPLSSAIYILSSVLSPPYSVLRICPQDLKWSSLQLTSKITLSSTLCFGSNKD